MDNQIDKLDREMMERENIKLRAALKEIAEGVEGRARYHECMGIHCATCNPLEWVELARTALGE